MVEESLTEPLIVFRAEDKRVALVNCVGLFATWATRLAYKRSDIGEFLAYLRHALNLPAYELQHELESDAVRAAVEYIFDEDDGQIVFCEVPTIPVGELGRRIRRMQQRRFSPTRQLLH